MAGEHVPFEARVSIRHRSDIRPGGRVPPSKNAFTAAALGLALLAVVVIILWGHACGYSYAESDGTPTAPGRACGAYRAGVAPIALFVGPLLALGLGRVNRVAFAIAATGSALALGIAGTQLQ